MAQLHLIVAGLVMLIAGALIALLGFVSKGVHQISWGLMVSGYVFFSLMTAGSSIVNSIYALFGYKGSAGELQRIIKIGVWFSLATVVPAVMNIFLDLSYPHMAWAMFAFFNPDSRIAWMGLLYVIYGAFLILELIYVLRYEPSTQLSRGLAITKLVLSLAVILAALALYTNLGQVFGSMISTPAWYGPHMGLLFVITAVYIGAAAQALYVHIAFREAADASLSRFYAKVLLVATPLVLFALGWTFITSSYLPSAWIVMREIVVGSFARYFWTIQILLGMIGVVVFAYLTVARASSASLMIASALAVLAGATFAYYIIIFPQQMVPEALNGLWRTFEHHISRDEVLAVAGSVLVWASLLVLGKALLPLGAEERPRKLFILK